MTSSQIFIRCLFSLLVQEWEETRRDPYQNILHLVYWLESGRSGEETSTKIFRHYREPIFSFLQLSMKLIMLVPGIVRL